MQTVWRQARDKMYERLRIITYNPSFFFYYKNHLSYKQKKPLTPNPIRQNEKHFGKTPFKSVSHLNGER